jgi:MYXO-CTERM domain-containing protein
MSKAGFVALLSLLWLASCVLDTTTTGVGGAGAPAREPSAAIPASLRFSLLRARQAAPGHEFIEAGGKLRARVGAHGAQADVDVAGGRATVVPAARGAGRAFALQTVHVGRRRAGSSAPRELPPIAIERAAGQEAVIDRAGVEERYLAGPLGLEQSYGIATRPEGVGPLAVEIAFEGLAPAIAADAADRVELYDAEGAPRAVYRDLAAFDAEGRDLPARMEVAGAVVTLVVDDGGAAYPIEIDPLVATLQTKLTASNGAANDWFGASVSVDGDTAVVGAYQDDGGSGFDQGSAYVFVRSGGVWTQQAQLTASDGAANDWFGAAVSVSGDTAVVGAYQDDIGANVNQGSAYVFVRSGGVWTQQAKLSASDGVGGDNFGAAVSVSGDTIVVGAHYHAIGANVDQGEAYVFVRSGVVWSQQAKLTASDGDLGDRFGSALSVSGDTIVVGAPSDDIGANGGQGSAYVFVRSGVVWSQQAKLTASDGGAGDSFGTSVSLDGDTAVLGASIDDNGVNIDQGSAYVFVRSGVIWSQQAKLVASDGAASDFFGASVGVSGDTLVVGAPEDDIGANAGQGSAYLYVRSGSAWTLLSKLTASDGAGNDFFGASVGVSGDTVLVGSVVDDIGANADQGSAYVFVVRKGLGDACGGGSECASGFCVDGVCCNTACSGACVACSVASGAPADGACSSLTGPACDDGNACTQTDTCQAGVCTGGNPVTCAASDQCHVAGTCNPATGACSNPPKSNGSVCNDGNGCTKTDTCQAGACVGGNPVVCAASDQCHDVGTCSPATGACSNPPKSNGSVCNDGNACTQTDTCQAGACTGANPVICTAPDQCHVAGTCNTGTGGCSNPPKPNGSACDDGNGCTQTDICQAGACVGGNPVVCTAPDACHDAGVCDALTGQCTTPAAKPNGTACSDGDACTLADTCQGGACVGNPMSCLAQDPCHDAGVCDPSTGICSNPAKLDGSSCDDGDACTQTDTCQGGACVGGNPVTCAAKDLCHDAGVCDPSTGVCSNPAQPDGSSCDDGDACTGSDTCQGGACVGSAPVTCAAKDPCHDAGVCDAATGQCSDPVKPDGTTCPMGACVSGVCSAPGSTSSGSGGGAGLSSSSNAGGATSSSGSGGGVDSEGGCSCRAAGDGEGPDGAAWLALLGVALAAARRPRWTW